MDQGQPVDSEPALPLAQMAERLERQGDHFQLHGAAGWLQGRTMYGGVSSFIAYTAIKRTFPDLPPLRAAQIGFIGPVSENLEVRVAMLRTGKSVSHVETSLWCDDALAFRATWLFGIARAPNGHNPAARRRDFTPPEAGTPHTHSPLEPAYRQQMEIRRDPRRDDDNPLAMRSWVRLRERAGLDPYAELIALGDAQPPGSYRATERRGPLSSINWSLTMLGDDLATRDGWWLIESASNHFADGFSSETLRMWNTEGVEVVRGLQSVAIFG